MTNAVLWDVAPCRTCVNRRSSETSLYTRLIWRHIPQDDILHNHRRENLKSYKCFNFCMQGYDLSPLP
jgi:hypothetical protein